MKTVTDILNRDFRISVELVPSMIDREDHPSLSDVLTTLEQHVNPSFISVTQGAGGTSREQSPFLLARLKAFDLCAHLICGFAPRGEVLRHAANFYAAGIRTFLVLRGDPPSGDGLPVEAKAPGDYKFAVECVRELRAKYPDLCLGVGAYPDAVSFEERIEFLRLKHDAGANFAITQMLFSPETYTKFVRELARPDFPILPSFCFIHSAEHAERFSKRFGVKIPWPLEPLPQLIEKFRAAGAPGVHLFVLNDIKLIESEFPRR